MDFDDGSEDVDFGDDNDGENVDFIDDVSEDVDFDGDTSEVVNF